MEEIEQLQQTILDLDGEAALLRSALMFLWGRMALDRNGGSARFTYEELDRLSLNRIDKVIAERRKARQVTG